MTKQTSNGTCRLCGKTMSKSGMTRHLDACMPRHEPGGRTGNLFRIRVEDAWSPLFWMDVEMRGSSRFGELDDFLRGIWLECCGHMSAFEKPRKAPARDFGLSFSSAPWEIGSLEPNDVDMDARLDKELGVDPKLDYTYDFGSSTRLKLRVTGVRKGHIGDETVRLLSRNEPPPLACVTCGAPATVIESEGWGGEAGWYCDAHVPEEIDEVFLLPVVNSPRLGVCAYTGPEPGSHYATL